MGNLTENRLDTIMAPEDLAAITEAVSVITSKLPAVSLTDVQRRRMKRINVANKVFVEDAITQATLNGEGILPPYISPAAMRRDLTLYEQADQIRATLTGLMQHIDDIKQVTGDELYSTALATYHFFESAHKAGVSNAITGYQALHRRFRGQGRKANGDLTK